MDFHSIGDSHRVQQRAAQYRRRYPKFANWAQGRGVVEHMDLTQVRVFDLCQELICSGRYDTLDDALAIFDAADTLTNAAMWLVAHMTYANKVDLSGQPLAATDFKENPQGHTGGSLNMVPAYIGYTAANSLAGTTRSWLMGQGHCVAAIDSVNTLLQNLHPEQEARYSLDEDGLTRLVSDFYSYAINPDGTPEAPLGSHVNPHTGGGLIEGGYLGFAELQYTHMPLPGERLVAFLSDGAFEEQRGSDWASRWWRAEDCGLVTPVMIANGRRIDQRSTIFLQGGTDWFQQHLELNGFHSIVIDGRDPAAFIWGIFEAESRLQACSDQVRAGTMEYPVRLPYLIAETIKGYGFYGAGSNAAHGTPLPAIPKFDDVSRRYFNDSVARLFIPETEVHRAKDVLATHNADRRSAEKDHPLSCREVVLQAVPEPQWLQMGEQSSPMAAVDQLFVALVKANPALRVRLGNPDELRSNQMNQTLDLLKHRALAPESGLAESLHGSVITALNEEAVVSAALGNKGGLNLVVSYEAFAMKMVGALRQEIIFARHQKRVGRPACWLSVPVIATSHLWENGKNEQSHQDPAFGDVLMGEMNDIARVVYPPDSNSAMACLSACYQTQGQVWAMTIPKGRLPAALDSLQAEQLVRDGAVALSEGVDVQLVAVGAYQRQVCQAVAADLSQQGISCGIVCLLEPGRFRDPRDGVEAEHQSSSQTKATLFPSDIKLRVFVCHMRPETLLGVCRPLDLGRDRTLAFGYANHGGTLDTAGLLLANGSDPQSVKQAIVSRLDTLDSGHATRPQLT
ncbi:MAG: xylulose 5-phosphate 3-epimerase [Marinobacter sp.]|uniref:xylulose 5-phosphate 3-epimerase n=1 Tax=Marinobacter sp. TaxID=50741 RepID=UPI001B484CBB|nr:xylulose 5-phosphate 3-epimerase [Marinobacter sp.]MBQ0815573.1 xylulose 5-phosphate 3-epimerase [Marinobacter sp.]|tara:strand:+ start:5326 stop:7713 length:2388 start_codon:yes stop_codon:yes gene_type:complete